MSVLITKISKVFHEIRRKLFFKEITVEEYNKINKIEYNKDSKSTGDEHLGGGGCMFHR